MSQTQDRDDAFADLKENGVPVTIKRTVNGVFNSSSGTVNKTEQTFNTYGIILEYRTSEIDGTLIKAEDKRILLAISPSMPSLISGDILTIGQSQYRVINASSVCPQGVDIIYWVQSRRM